MPTPEQLFLYSRKTNLLRFPIKEKPYKIIFVPENTDITKTFDLLNIKTSDVRFYSSPKLKIQGRLITTIKEFNSFMSEKNFTTTPFLTQLDKRKRNCILDLTNVKSFLETILKKRYTSPKANLLYSNVIEACTSDKDFKNIILYIIDQREFFEIANNRKFLWIPVFHYLRKQEEIPNIDIIILGVISKKENETIYVKIYDKESDSNKYDRVLNILKSIKYDQETLETFKEEIANQAKIEENDFVKEVIKQAEKEDLIIPEENILTSIKASIKKYAEKNPEYANLLLDRFNNIRRDSTIEETITFKTLILNLLKNDLNIPGSEEKTSKNLIKNIDLSKLTYENISKYNKILDKLIQEYIERNALKKEIPSNLSTDVLVKHLNFDQLLEYKLPKRFMALQDSLDIAFINDLIKILNAFSKKEYPLKITNIRLENIKDEYDVKTSNYQRIFLKFKNDLGHEFENEIRLPLIEKNKLLINGVDKYLVTQILRKPVFFPEKHVCRISSFFATIELEYRSARNVNYGMAYVTGLTVPLHLLMLNILPNGWDDFLKYFKLQRKDLIIAQDPKEAKEIRKTNPWEITFHNKTSLFFPKDKIENNPVLKSMYYSMRLINYEKKKITLEQFLDNTFQKDLLILATGKKQAAHNIENFSKNFLDMLTKENLEIQGYPQDLPSLLWKCTELIHTDKVDEKTDLNNQRIRNKEALLHILYKQLNMAYESYKTKRELGIDSAHFSINPNFIFKELVNNQLIRIDESLNPIEKLSNLFRITLVGIGGIENKEAIPDSSRQIHPSYFGNIDPIDTPEGGSNIGILQHLTVNTDVLDTRGNIKVKEITQNEKSGIFSINSVLTPFHNHNDGARAMMAANQIRQAVPLAKKEVPLVQTGYETSLVGYLTDDFVKKTPISGVVKTLDINSMTIESKTGKVSIDLKPTMLYSGQTVHVLSYFEPKVKIGDKVEKNQIVAEGACIKNGTLCLGTNLLTAFMFFEGATFDDSIVVSKDIENDITSKHIEKIEILVPENSKILKAPGYTENNFLDSNLINKLLTNEGIDYLPGDILFSFIPNNISEYIELFTDENVYEKNSVTFKAKYKGKIVDIKIYANDDISKYPILKPLYFISKEKHKIPEDGNFKYKGEKFHGIFIEITFEYIDEGILEGNKYCNRHGNKGIVSLVLDEMPRTPWGQKIDIILNPLGIVSRMNMGQMFELYLGLISWKVRDLILKNPTKKNITEIISNVFLKHLDKTKNQTISKTYLKVINNFSKNDLDIFIENLKAQKGLPWIYPTFSTPKLNDIETVLKMLELRDKYYLDLPHLGKGFKTKEPVPVGYLYFYKLEHLAKIKSTSRATGTYDPKTGQPLAGRKNLGGQRIGEFDSWSLFSHGATNFLKEAFGALSDDMISKNEMISNIIEDGFTHIPEKVKTTPTRDLLEVYFRLMLLDFK